MPPELPHDFVITARQYNKKNKRNKNEWDQPEELVEGRAGNAIHPLKNDLDDGYTKYAAKCPDDGRRQVKGKRERPEQVGYQKDDGNENEQPEIFI